MLRLAGRPEESASALEEAIRLYEAKGNVVAACKECNTRKRLMTPAEQVMMKPLHPPGED